MKRETALAAAALEGRTQALARQEAAAAEAKALLTVRTKELDSREVHLCLLSSLKHETWVQFTGSCPSMPFKTCVSLLRWPRCKL